MNRDHPIGSPVILRGAELMQVAFHEAGHAAAIYLHNKQRKLPPVYFHITLPAFNPQKYNAYDTAQLSHADCRSTLKGGLLIQSLAMSVGRDTSPQDVLAYQTAYEADIINLLAGPLSEAKHIAQRDGEYINARLVNIDALKNYGGKSDLEKVEEYLKTFSAEQGKRTEKLGALFSAAFHFIDQPDYWRAITQLAHFILANERERIGCEEAIAVLDASIEKSSLFK